MPNYQELPPGLFAFVNSDQFPYVWGDEITHMGDGGFVYTKGCGRGYSFKPIKIVPAEEGKATLEQLNQLKEERKAALKVVEGEYQAKLDLVFKV